MMQNDSITNVTVIYFNISTLKKQVQEQITAVLLSTVVLDSIRFLFHLLFYFIKRWIVSAAL